MKLFLLICSVLSWAVLASSYPSEDDLGSLMNLEIAPVLGYDDAIYCVKDALSQIMNENEDMQWWFDDIEKTGLKYVDLAKKCLAGNQEKKCLLGLKTKGLFEIRHILKTVPKNKKKIFYTLKEYIMKCVG